MTAKRGTRIKRMNGSKNKYKDWVGETSVQQVRSCVTASWMKLNSRCDMDILVIFCVLIATVLYYNTLHAGFVYDDRSVIEMWNPIINLYFELLNPYTRTSIHSYIYQYVHGRISIHTLTFLHQLLIKSGFTISRRHSYCLI